MNLLISSSSDPYWNLATEEFLLKNSPEDFIFLYVNKPCVVVGKHQNTQKEINSKFIHQNKILVARRLSGGGAVYHDDGNLNFSYIQTIPFGGNISYKEITQSMFGFLQEITPELTLSERNDFLLEGKKVSGSAMHVYKNRVLAHGTLLINSNLNKLSASLAGNKNRFVDKSIDSRRTAVTNLSEVVKGLNIRALIKRYSNFLENNSPIQTYALPDSSLNPIKELATDKYSDNNWIFGYSPKYLYNGQILYNGITVAYTMEVAKGLIEAVISEQENKLESVNRLKLNGLIGMPHNLSTLSIEFKKRHSTRFDDALFDSLF